MKNLFLFIIVLITALTSAFVVIDTAYSPRTMDIYTLADMYHVNLRTLHITSETGQTDLKFDTYQEMRDWIDQATANDTDITQPEPAKWIISHYITVIAGDSITVNLGGQEMDLPYQETDPNGNRYYYIID